MAFLYATVSEATKAKMRAVIQRVTHASVAIEGLETQSIGPGLLVLLGIGHQDTGDDVIWLAKKLVDMRIFSDTEGKMNLSVKDIGGQVLLISQFTLLGNAKKGNRPSFIDAAAPAHAIPLYQAMIQELGKLMGEPIKTGQFGADMKVSLLNDGPVTLILDSAGTSR